MNLIMPRERAVIQQAETSKHIMVTNILTDIVRIKTMSMDLIKALVSLVGVFSSDFKISLVGDQINDIVEDRDIFSVPLDMKLRDEHCCVLFATFPFCCLATWRKT